MYIIPERMCQAMERKTGAQPPVFLIEYCWRRVVICETRTT